MALRFTGLGGLSAAGVAATEGPHSSFLLQKFGHRAFAARFGPAEVFVNLKQAFARELGADIRGGERCTEESHRGGAKQTRVSRRRPCFHLLAEIGLRAFRHRTQHLKKKGAGAVESVISLMAMNESWLPPTTTIGTPDPVCRFDLVREARDAKISAVLTNSFGFGGANATLVMKKLS